MAVSKGEPAGESGGSDGDDGETDPTMQAALLAAAAANLVGMNNVSPSGSRRRDRSESPLRSAGRLKFDRYGRPNMPDSPMSGRLPWHLEQLATAAAADDNGEDSAAENDSDESDGDGEGGRVGGVFVLDEAEDE